MNVALLAASDRAQPVHLCVDLTGPHVLDSCIRRLLGPILRRYTNEGTVRNFWFVVREDASWHIHLRMVGETKTIPVVREAIVRALRPGVPHSGIDACRELVYEPETALFGGPWGREQVHKLFCCDSQLTIAWRALSPKEQAGLSAHQVSVLLLQHLLRSAGLTLAERRDVWARVAWLWPVEDMAALAEAWEANRADVILLAASDVVALAERISPPGGPILLEAANGFEQVAKILGMGRQQGLLQRDLRHLLATFIRFHWNRMLFRSEEQCVLAHLMSRVSALNFAQR